VTGVIPGVVLYLLAIIIIPERPEEKIPEKPKDDDERREPRHPLAEN
jgi:hypothetical protein